MKGSLLVGGALGATLVMASVCGGRILANTFKLVLHTTSQHRLATEIVGDTSVFVRARQLYVCSLRNLCIHEAEHLQLKVSAKNGLALLQDIIDERYMSLERGLSDHLSLSAFEKRTLELSGHQLCIVALPKYQLVLLPVELYLLFGTHMQSLVMLMETIAAIPDPLRRSAAFYAITSFRQMHAYTRLLPAAETIVLQWVQAKKSDDVVAILQGRLVGLTAYLQMGFGAGDCHTAFPRLAMMHSLLAFVYHVATMLQCPDELSTELVKAWSLFDAFYARTLDI